MSEELKLKARLAGLEAKVEAYRSMAGNLAERLACAEGELVKAAEDHNRTWILVKELTQILVTLGHGDLVDEQPLRDVI